MASTLPATDRLRLGGAPTEPPDARPSRGVELDFASNESGRRIGRYRLVYPVGEGGMSVVYLARDEVLERDVAVKVMHRHLARDPEARARFGREARAVARLTHRNIPEIYDFSGMDAKTSDGPAYIVTELIDGPALSKLLREGPPALPEVGIMMAVGVAKALAHAHSQSIVHRDVKPENVLVGKDGVVKLTDFGIAQVRGLESMTMTGTLIGSPAHMAPEQIESSRDIDHRADIWGLGTVLYMVATGGTLPFEADNPHRLLKKIVEGQFQDPRRLSPHVDSRLAAIVKGCLVVDRDKRYQSADEVARELESWLAERDLTHYEDEIRRFMADPEGYGGALGRRLVNTLVAAGDAALGRGERGRALELFGRVLALEPDDPIALARVHKLEGQLRTRRGLVRYGALVLGIGLVAGALVLALRPGEQPPTPAGETAAVRRIVVPRAPVMAPVVEMPFESGTAFGEALGIEVVRAAAQLARVEAEGPPDGRTDRPPRRPDRPDRPEAKPVVPVAVRLTAFPPAVKIKVGQRTLTAGEVLSLAPGRYQVTLTHPSCEGCADDIHQLEVPETERFEQHFRFEKRTTELAPASLFVTCDDEGYVVDGGGRRYQCNVRYDLPVSSPEPRLITLSGYRKTGELVKRQQFTVSPKRPIEWTL